MLKFRSFFEKYGFTVPSRLAERLGMRTKDVRIVSIYGTFATLGTWFGAYLLLASLLKIKDLLYTKRISVSNL